jgi:hypothetical protein
MISMTDQLVPMTDEMNDPRHDLRYTSSCYRKTISWLTMPGPNMGAAPTSMMTVFPEAI